MPKKVIILSQVILGGIQNLVIKKTVHTKPWWAYNISLIYYCVLKNRKMTFLPKTGPL